MNSNRPIVISTTRTLLLQLQSMYTEVMKKKFWAVMRLYYIGYM